MNIVGIIFMLLAFTIFKGLVLADTATAPPFTVPTLTIPSFAFRDLSGGCGGFTDCIEFAGLVLYDIALSIIFFVLLLINLSIYVVRLFALFLVITFAGFDGAPGWLSVLFSMPIAIGVAVIIYKLVRSGSSNAE